MSARGHEKMLILWKEEVPHKLSPNSLKKISSRLLKCAKFIPTNFNRKPRSLAALRHWKATEFRLFLLYVGPYVLKGVLDDKRYSHFLLFHTAVYILCSNSDEMYVNYAGSLLLQFFSDFCNVYSRENCVFNVHTLSNLHLDCKIHGKLDNFSAFPFENYMSRLKRMIRSQNHYLAQIVNRITEGKNELFSSLNDGEKL